MATKLTVLSSFYALHEQQDSSANELSDDQYKQSLLSKLALNYITRIVIDVARAFNANFSSFNMTAIPPGYTYIFFFRAALHHIRLSSQSESVQWFSDLESLRKAAWRFQHRWKIASKQSNSYERYFDTAKFVSHLENYLKEIDSIAEDVAKVPLREYASFILYF
jgi:hypothetical protein